MSEEIKFDIVKNPPGWETASVTGMPVLLAGIGGFAVHPKPENWAGAPWAVSHVSTGGLVAFGSTAESAIANAESLAAQLGGKFEKELKRVVKIARIRITVAKKKAALENG